MVGDRDHDQEKHQSTNKKPAGSTPGSGETHWYDEFELKEESHRDRQERRRNLKKRRMKKHLLAAAAIFLLLLAGVGAYAYNLYEEVREPQRVLLDQASDEHNYDVDQAFSDRIVNIALLGFDRGWSREKMGEDMFRPDALGVFSIDFATGEVSVVRITRDAYVPIYGISGLYDKINHAYFFGYTYGDSEDSHRDGIKYTLNTISHTLGDIPIHYYVSVDMYSVIELVDAVGGIYYEVEETIYDKHWDVGRVLVPEGPQVMDGKTYLRYMQYRDDATDQDYGRIKRQMSLLEETFVYLRDEGQLTDLPAIYRIYNDYVETDLNYTQIASLVYFARDLDTKDLHYYTLPGDGQTKDGIWYQILKQDERLEIIREVFGVEAERWPPIVLEDSPEYLEEQERKRREEERDFPFRRDEEDSGLRDNEPEEEDPYPEEAPEEQPEEPPAGNGAGTGEEEPAGQEGADSDPGNSGDPAAEEGGG